MDKITVSGKFVSGINFGTPDYCVTIELSLKELAKELSIEDKIELDRLMKILPQPSQSIYPCCYESAKEDKPCPIHGRETHPGMLYLQR